MRAGNQNHRNRAKQLPPVLLPGSQQHLFGLVDLGGEVGRAPLVRMQLLHQRTVRPFDLAGVGPRRHAKDLIIVLKFHLRILTRPATKGQARVLGKSP